MLAASTARAECVVRTQDAPGLWRDAAHAVEASLEATPNDCAVIDIRADRHGAFVDLQTTDGREAIRHIGAPTELGPLVRALLTSVPPEPPLEHAVAAPPLVPTAVVEPEVDRTADRTSAPPSASTSELYAGLATGLKVQTGDDPAALGRVHGGISLGDWQIGGFGRWEFEHHLDAQPRHTRQNAVGGGVTLGRRRALGPTLIVFGVQGGLFSVRAEAGGRHGVARTESDVLDPRAGLYAGLVMPAIGRVRSRVQLESEVELIDRDDVASALPNVPDWGMALTLGIDFGVVK